MNSTILKSGNDKLKVGILKGVVENAKKTEDGKATLPTVLPQPASPKKKEPVKNPVKKNSSKKTK